MEKKIKSKILFVCLNDAFGKEISQNFAQSINFNLLVCKEMIEYDLFNSGDILKQLGVEYYNKRERDVVKNMCSFENVLMLCNYDNFFKNKDIFTQSATIIYLKFPKRFLQKDDFINKLAFDGRNSDLSKIADFVIDLKSLNQKSAQKQILLVLGGI